MKKIEKWQLIFCNKKTPVQSIGQFKGVSICVKRDDLNHSVIQGNKLRKLKYNFRHALEQGHNELITFGGAYSNHILALAQAANLCGLKSTGFIRGEELKEHKNNWSPTLKQAVMYGMQLKFLSRSDYRLKQESIVVKEYLQKCNAQVYIVPEGGSNALAIKGVMEIIDEIHRQNIKPTHIITACGTGGTLAGLIDGVSEHGWKTKLIGIPVLKGAQFLEKEVEKLSQRHASSDWQLYYDYHAGGYAKINTQTHEFAKDFSKNTSIPLDKVYTAKAFYAAYDLIEKGKIPAKSKVLILHTGGLQGGVI